MSVRISRTARSESFAILVIRHPGSMDRLWLPSQARVTGHSLGRSRRPVPLPGVARARGGAPRRRDRSARLQVGVEGQRDRRSRHGFGDGKVAGPMPESLNVRLQVQRREVIAAGDPVGPERSQHVIASGSIASLHPDDIHEPADFTRRADRRAAARGRRCLRVAGDTPRPRHVVYGESSRAGRAAPARARN